MVVFIERHIRVINSNSQYQEVVSRKLELTNYRVYVHFFEIKKT